MNKKLKTLKDAIHTVISADDLRKVAKEWVNYVNGKLEESRTNNDDENSNYLMGYRDALIKFFNLEGGK